MKTDTMLDSKEVR